MQRFVYYRYRLFLRCLLSSDFNFVHLRMVDTRFIVTYPCNYCELYDKLKSSLDTLVEFGILVFLFDEKKGDVITGYYSTSVVDEIPF